MLPLLTLRATLMRPLPAGCVYSSYSGRAYYGCGGTWFSPAYGANGVYYRVVPPP
jgi:hypothetical protein